MGARIRVLAIAFALAGCKDSAPREGFTSGEGKCLVDHDCVISCDVRGDCCDSPYCENVQHKDVAVANAAFNTKECTDDKRKNCPDVGSRAKPNYRLVPKCQAGACIGEKIPIARVEATGSGSASPSTGGSEVVDTAGYETTCKTKADCKIVKDDPCNPCSCADKSIAATEVTRFEVATGAIKCGPRQKIACGECRGSFADCHDGKCIAKPE